MTNWLDMFASTNGGDITWTVFIAHKYITLLINLFLHFTLSVSSD